MNHPDIKIFYQSMTVNYADYKSDKYYGSVLANHCCIIVLKFIPDGGFLSETFL
jgi:hypothetical protein